MRQLALLSLLPLLVALPAAAQVPPPGKVTYAGRTYSGTLPIFDKGYLFYLKDQYLTVYAPGGMKMIDTVPRDPDGQDVWGVLSAAIDTDGTVAAAVSYWTPEIARGAIVFLDASGHQTFVVPMDGLFQPAHICFDENHMLWVFGWHRDTELGARNGPRDHYLVRKLSKDGEEMGRYLPRSQHRPFYTYFGMWTVAAAMDRIGILTQLDGSSEREFLELNLEGKQVSQWRLGKGLNGGFAYTNDRRLFAKRYTNQGTELVEFDRARSEWGPVKDVSLAGEPGYKPELLLGATGRWLVFGDKIGQNLIWAETGQ